MSELNCITFGFAQYNYNAVLCFSSLDNERYMHIFKNLKENYFKPADIHCFVVACMLP